MNVKYDAEADVLIFSMRDAPPCEAISKPSGVIISYDENAELVSIEFLNASKQQLSSASSN
ncbi:MULTISPECIES: DUF2283 domain-containing protein [Cyanophyceae]|uniref:DUF2283 domain-containing protein n=1 Tax=Cyanophyceae TaxID=3028117 RepID=UPI001683BAEC|nr:MULTISPECIES: DUF2283 domain-containing protein [Cyanophyceae]MBD1919090.1 DUF2283 domain-containing protein [Phormidium sp. FACHB-77]MBD2033091.1 DUF2283 domain-containing protein [Phormidium sp. FACHB-322]MBD2054019.1 DUF2283 domain-containing protein [Leptolyngbya sp. FACHB-60]